MPALVRAAQPDQGQDHREGRRADGQQRGPQPGRGRRGDQQPQVARQTAEHDHDHHADRPTMAGRVRREDEGQRDPDRGGDAQEGPGRGRGEAGIDVDRGQPAEDGVRLQRLQAEEDGQDPADPGAADVADGDRRVAGAVRAAVRPVPPASSSQAGTATTAVRAQIPRPQRQPSGRPARLRDRHGGEAGHGDAGGQRGAVRRAEQTDPVGKVPFDQAGHQYVGGGQPGQGQCRGRQEDHGRAGESPHDLAGDHHQQTQQHCPVQPDRGRQTRRQDAEPGKAQHRQGGEQPGLSAAQGERVADHGQLRADGQWPWAAD